MNREAYESLECKKNLCVILGASHLFEEPGTLDQVSRLAADWFQQHLGALASAPDALESGKPSRAHLHH
jgi:putative phosphoribosyl transferase